MQALHQLMEEDPTLRVQRDAQTKEIILSGVGQLHIEVAVERLKRKFGVEVELKAPKVPYKETIKGTRQGAGQAQEADRRPRPVRRLLARGRSRCRAARASSSTTTIVGGVIPRQFIPAVEKGVREALPEGILAGYPIVDVKVTLYDGSYHDVDSSEMAFKIAALDGLQDGVRASAKPVLLEPIMTMEVAVPDECMGDVIGDLNSRRGKVLGVDPKPGGQVIRARCRWPRCSATRPTCAR